jgi:phage protein U
MSITSGRPIPRVGPVVFTLYGDRIAPRIDVTSDTRTVEKEVIGKQPITQVVGPGKERVTFRCECTLETANEVDELDEEGVVTVRTARANGEYIVLNTRTEEERFSEEDGPLYVATIELREVVA